MAFTHSKNAKLFVDQYELTKFFNDFSMGAKAGTAESTVYGVGAKTYIGGLKEGQVTAKGYFGAAGGVDNQDPELTAALGRSTNMALDFVPSGVVSTAAGQRCVVAYAAETDLSIMAPVTGVVATSFSAQADSGLSTGVILYDPTTAPVVTAVGPVNGTSIQDANPPADLLTTTTGINNLGAGGFLTGTGTLLVASTAGFPSTGILGVAVGGSGVGTSQVAVQYTGLSGGNTFTGCTTLNGGTGSTAAGSNVALPVLTSGGMVLNLHVFTLSGNNGTNFPSLNVQVQESDDNNSWITLATFGPTINTFGSGAFGQGTIGSPGSGGNITTVGGYTALVAYGTPISRYLRTVWTTALNGAPSISTTFMVTAARQ